MNWGLKRKRAIVGGILALVVALVLLLAPILGSWGPLYHWSCGGGAQATVIPDSYIPAVLVNSPFGGSGWGNGTIPVNFPGAWRGPPDGVTKVEYGTGALRGQALGAFFSVNISVIDTQNVTVFGPGTNSRCSQAFSIQFEPPSDYIEIGGAMLGPNNTSDVNEPHFALFEQGSPNPPLRSLLFNNSFSAANQPNVTTCGRQAEWLSLTSSSSLQTWLLLTVDGKNYSIPYEFTFVQTFHYSFPADFGTWQIDNLSAPGGPGGGWAFSYSPCS